MSLINEALKKAQMEHHGKDAPAARSPDLTQVARGPGLNRQVVVAGSLIALLSAAGGIWYYLHPESEMPPVSGRLMPGRVEPITIQAPAKEVAPVITEAVVVAKPVASVISSPPPVVVPAVQARNDEVANLIDLMQVSLGRKATGRCMIDGHILKVGDRVSSEPLITILSVTDDSVIFSDTRGVEYAKKFKQGSIP